MSGTSMAVLAKGFGLMLEKSRGALDAHRISTVPLDKIVAGAKLAAAASPVLYSCSTTSVLLGVYQAARLGLEVGGPMGHCYLVPYKNDAKLIVGYKGMIELALRSGRIVSLIARVVRVGDTFTVTQGTTESITHIPLNLDATRMVEAVYAVAQLANGAPALFDVMSFEEVRAIQGRSPSGNTGPWITDWEQMARKTVLRRLANVLPMSPEFAAALQLIDRETGATPVTTEILDAEIIVEA